jgi:hypothetical protein
VGIVTEADFISLSIRLLTGKAPDATVQTTSKRA